MYLSLTVCCILQVWMLRLPVWHCSPDEAVWIGPLSPSKGRKGNSLTFSGAYCKAICYRRVSAVQSGGQIVIICLSWQPASKLMKFDGKGKFRVEDRMAVIWKYLQVHCKAPWDNSPERSCQTNVLRFKCFIVQAWLQRNQSFSACQGWKEHVSHLICNIFTILCLHE